MTWLQPIGPLDFIMEYVLLRVRDHLNVLPVQHVLYLLPQDLLSLKSFLLFLGIRSVLVDDSTDGARLVMINYRLLLELLFYEAIQLLKVFLGLD